MHLQQELLTLDLHVPFKRNELEQDNLIQPSLDLPSKKDEKRIWGLAHGLHLIESLGATMNRDIAFDQNRQNPAVRKHIQYTLDRWEKARRPAPQMVRERRGGHAVVESSKSPGTMRLLPYPVRLQLLDQLHLVALEDTENSVSETGIINKALEMLLLAAELEHKDARSITHRAAERGSRAAEQRLKVLNPQLSIKARQTLHNLFGGIGYQIQTNLRHPEEEGCTFYITLRRLDRTDSGGFDVDDRTETGETPLLHACRSGHAHTVDILIEAGADASIGSDENIQPLHFLSSFDDCFIPRIAELLKDNRSDVHARTKDAAVFGDRLDARFSQYNGTTLLWAVIVDCTAAVVALLELGADPFDDESRKSPVDDKWGSNFHHSPVDWAVWKHQHYMLELLIPEPQLPFMTSLLDILPNAMPKIFLEGF
ncbi:hypothetical protein VTL71DRAFT_9482 [Oculimacula yallundae]|uniref:Ankyrin n=1 Tax=Oculimacula yallundae TaxID=86028 RepID=A0ABR4BTM0_9HELO